MRTLTVTAFGVLFTLAYASFPLQLLTSDQVVTATFSDSVLLSLPPCSLAGQMVTLTYYNMAIKQQTTLLNAFAVPQCRNKRDLLGVSQNSNQYIGYRVTNLVNGTQYRFQYTVGNNMSDLLLASTIQAVPYAAIYDGLPARSGAMVVMTVVLAVALFLLIVGLVVTVVFAHCVKVSGYKQ